MDDIDLALLGILARNGRATYSELAEQVGLSGPSTADRVHRLEGRGAIRGYAARLNPEVLGLGMTAFVAVTLADSSARKAFLDTMAGSSKVVECHHVAGDDDYLVKVHVDGTRGLESFISDELKALPGVARTRTTVVLSTSLDRPLSPDRA
jgi:Lrp/AsnC family leucine-responsive transcriptional regulator